MNRKLKLNIATLVVLLVVISSSIATNITAYVDETNNTIEFSGSAFLLGNSGSEGTLGVAFSGPTTPEMTDLVNLRFFFSDDYMAALNVIWIPGTISFNFDGALPRSVPDGGSTLCLVCWRWLGW